MNVNEKEDLMITCKSGVTIRTSIANIREAGRATQGVKLIRLDDGDEIAAITKLTEHDEEETIENGIINDIINEPDVPGDDLEDNSDETSNGPGNEFENQ